MINVGSSVCGAALPVEGQVRNLHVYQSGPSSLEASFLHEGLASDERHALTYLNGTLAAIDSDGLASISGLESGNQNINIIPQIEFDPISQRYFDDEDGQRVLLTWQPSTEAIDGYRIYKTDLDGTNPALVAEINGRVLQSANSIYPTTGIGLGRISAAPVPLPESAYGYLEITITGSGAFSWSVGAESGTGEFTRGVTVYLVFGIGIFFVDDPGEYVIGDKFQLAAGVQNRWLSGQLTPGNHRYGISAFTIEGDESTMALTQIYEIVAQADPVTVVTETWNDIAKTLQVQFDLPSGAASVNLYSNFESQEGWLDQFVSLSPQANSTSGFMIPFNDIEGEFRYYLRPLTAAGVELQDATLRTITVPVINSGIVLGKPENLVGTRVGVLNWKLSWTYIWQDADELTHFEVFRNSVSVGTVIASLDAEGIQGQYEFEMTGETEPAGDQDIYIVSHTAGSEITTSETITITTSSGVTIDPPAGVVGGAV